MGDDKVSVSIREIENGYIVDRNWCEKTKKKNGDESYDYHNESYYLASLPPLLAKMFTKGKNAQDMGGKPSDEGKDEFASAIDDMEEEAESPEEEEKEDEEGDD